MCSGVVPQQPPTTLTPSPSTNAFICSAKAFGERGYTVRPSITWGIPALGMHETLPGQVRQRVRMCDFIPSGPVAQFNPSEKTGNGSIAAAAAATSEPTSIVPVSAPIAWDELDDPSLRPDRWTVRSMLDRVAEVGDLFAAAQTDLQELPKV